MLVYFHSSLWSSTSNKGTPGEPQQVSWQFKYKGLCHFIPVIYRFPKGVVWDVLTPLDSKPLLDFYQSYASCEHSLSTLEEEMIQQKHPYQNLSLFSLKIDDRFIENFHSSSRILGTIPWEAEASQADKIAEQGLRQAYPEILSCSPCFGCQRFCALYPRKMRRPLRPVNSLSFVLQQELELLPLSKTSYRFVMAQGGVQGFSFVHPRTGILHTVWLQQVKQQRLSQLFRFSPFSVTTGQYELEPSLNPQESLRFSQTMLETVRMPFGGENACSIGIIGGADGPTAVLVTEKEPVKTLGVHGLPLSSCTARPSTAYPDPFPEFALEAILVHSQHQESFSFSTKTSCL